MTPNTLRHYKASFKEETTADIKIYVCSTQVKNTGRQILLWVWSFLDIYTLIEKHTHLSCKQSRAAVLQRSRCWTAKTDNIKATAKTECCSQSSYMNPEIWTHNSSIKISALVSCIFQDKIFNYKILLLVYKAPKYITDMLRNYKTFIFWQQFPFCA